MGLTPLPPPPALGPRAASPHTWPPMPLALVPPYSIPRPLCHISFLGTSLPTAPILLPSAPCLSGPLASSPASPPAPALVPHHLPLALVPHLLPSLMAPAPHFLPMALMPHPLPSAFVLHPGALLRPIMPPPFRPLPHYAPFTSGLLFPQLLTLYCSYPVMGVGFSGSLC